MSADRGTRLQPISLTLRNGHCVVECYYMFVWTAGNKPLPPGRMRVVMASGLIRGECPASS